MDDYEFTESDYIPADSPNNVNMVMFNNCDFLKKKTKKKKITKSDKKIKSKYIINKCPVEFNHRTMEYYRAIRKTKLDPITYVEVDEDTAFKINYMWDPYTGEKLKPDPYGPLYMDPINLVYYLYSIRLKKLWMDHIDEQDGYFQGTYDDAAGIGEEFIVKGRGNFPEWYVFRIPIADCYLNKDHMRQVVTFGPKLSYEEICDIDKKACLIRNEYYRRFGKKKPCLITMYKLYHQAIDNNPPIENMDSMTNDEILTAKNKYNMAAIDKLRQIVG